MRISALLVAGLVALTLTGCQTDDPIVVPQPEPSSTPLFASEEEALAAAEEAFGEYLNVADQIYADGGSEPERLESVATGTALEEDLKGFANYASEGKRSSGSTMFDSVALQSSDLSGFAISGAVVIYACEDFKNVQVFDASGLLLTAPDRQTRWPVSVTLDVADGTKLLVSEVELWSGDDFCVD